VRPIISNTSLTICLCLSLNISFQNLSLAHEQQVLKIAGTGDSEALLSSLKIAFELSHPEALITVPESVGSAGGIRALKLGNTDLARTARQVKNNDGLVEFLFAISPVVFATHPSLEKFSSLTSEQITDIYSGKITNWKQLGGPDHKLYVVDREANDSSRIALERMMPDFEKLKSVGKIFYTVPTVAKAIAKHPFTIGYLPLSTAKSNQLNIVSTSYPGAKFVGNNVHSPSVPLYIVSKGPPKGLAKQFVDYLFSDEARAYMKQLGVVPVKRGGSHE